MMDASWDDQRKVVGPATPPANPILGTQACQPSSPAARCPMRKGLSGPLCQDLSSRGEPGPAACGAAGHRSPSAQFLPGFEGRLHALFQRSEFLDQRVPIEGFDILSHRLVPKLYGERIQGDQPSKPLGGLLSVESRYFVWVSI